MVSEKHQQYGLTVNAVGFQKIEPTSPYPLYGHRSGYFFNATKKHFLTTTNLFISLVF